METEYYSNEFEEDIILSPIIDTEKIEQGYIRFTYEKPSEDGTFVTAEAIVILLPKKRSNKNA